MDATDGGKRDPAESERVRTQRRISSRELFRGGNELVIDHRGEEYRLRLTKNDKLILNK